MSPAEALQKAIAIAGSQTALASLIGLKPPQTVSVWVNRDKRASARYAAKISQATGVPCHELRPDIFPAPANDDVYNDRG